MLIYPYNLKYELILLKDSSKAIAHQKLMSPYNLMYELILLKKCFDTNF